MSITVSTPNQICMSSLNHSKSKSLYSFPKTERFKENHKPLCDNIYNSNSTISNRKAAFGYGNKYDFTKTGFATPAPNNYNITSEIDQQTKTKYGWSFGESRSKMKGGGIFKKHLELNPGPGKYESKTQLSDVKYTMRQKVVNPDDFNSALQNPGPGKYEKYETITDKGNLMISKFGSSKATVINPQSSVRFKENAADNKVPGSGHYSQGMTQMAKDGKYYVSNLKNSFCRSFTHQNRHGIMDSLKEKLKVPGVGNYRLPSEFGYYESSKK